MNPYIKNEIDLLEKIQRSAARFISKDYKKAVLLKWCGTKDYRSWKKDDASWDSHSFARQWKDA